MARKRMQVRSSSLVGSSDFTRVKSKRAILELNHKEFEKNLSMMTFKKSSEKSSKEPAPNTIVKVLILGKYISMQYSVVKAAGYNNWML